eukprot:104245-Prymnesium_polylepis.1
MLATPPGERRLSCVAGLFCASNDAYQRSHRESVSTTSGTTFRSPHHRWLASGWPPHRKPVKCGAEAASAQPVSTTCAAQNAAAHLSDRFR